MASGPAGRTGALSLSGLHGLAHTHESPQRARIHLCFLLGRAVSRLRLESLCLLFVCLWFYLSFKNAL